MAITITKALRRLVLAAGLALPAAASAGYSQLYVLGDSLSDVGNVGATHAALVAANGGQPLPILGLDDPNTPSPYAPDRASNGPLWVDVLAGAFGFTSTASLYGGTNYAFGGARTDNQLYNPVIPDFLGLLQQRDALLAARPALDPNALYVVWGGANNLQDILTGRPRADGTAQTISKTVGDLQNIIDTGGYTSQWQTSGSDKIMVRDDGTAIGVNTETGESYALNPEQVQTMVDNGQLNTAGSGYVAATGGTGTTPGGSGGDAQAAAQAALRFS